MRQKRAKAYRKLMHLYSMSFGFRQPYQVLVDSEICKSAINQKLDLTKQLFSVLQGEIKPMITQCCIHELYLQGKSEQPSVDLAKMFERRKCNHREPIPGDECLASVIGENNKHRYVVATQSQPLRVKLRSVPATPIVHINRSVMVLEPPSDVTLKAKEALEDKALHATAPDIALVGPVKNEEARKKRKGPKGPNPLSVKKKKPEPSQHSKDTAKTDTASTEPSKRPAVGQKRKRPEDHDEHEDVVNSTEQQPTKTKRKRRRKSKTEIDATVNQT